MIPELVCEAIQPITGPIQDTRSVGGGSMANAARLEASNGIFFLKWAEGDARHTFAAEAEGLRTLREVADPADLFVPKPLFVEVAEEGPGFQLMEWIERGTARFADWNSFGRAMAALHRAEASIGEDGSYGYATDNWIGSKPQLNRWAQSWPMFFGERRLGAQVDTVRKLGAWKADWDAPLKRLITRLGEILPEAPHPSVLHGDLWAGNALSTVDGRFALIDPAVYIGHREADLAMTELFGGFAPGFYEGYREAWPLEPGYPDRREVYNLYHLINHLTHGPGYAGQVEHVLVKFGSL